MTRQPSALAVYALSFVLAACSLLYELLIATSVSFLTGDTLVTYSVVIGLFLTWLGLGSYLSNRFAKQSLRRLIQIELLLSVLGGLSVILLHVFLITTPYFTLAWVGLTLAVATLSGFEVPLLTFLLQKHSQKSLFATVLSFDYLGGLLASLLFPFLLIPYLGTVVTGVLIGIVNIGCAGYLLYFLKPNKTLKIATAITGTGLLLTLVFAGQVYRTLETRLYRDEVVYSTRSRYQTLTLTHQNNRTSLYLDGKIQFSSRDQYRYHEFMSYTLLSHLPANKNNLRVGILGGGDGLLATQLRRFDDRLAEVVLVELDSVVIELATNNELVRELNEEVFAWEKLTVITADAFTTLQDLKNLDAVLIDFPDPQDLPTARLYSREFYTTLRQSLVPEGVFVTQATSPWSVPQAFWGIHKTIASRFTYLTPYQVTLPSFGTEWGFIAASNAPLPETEPDTKNSRFFESLAAHRISKDNHLSESAYDSLTVNTLDNLVLTTYYRRFE